MCEEKNCANIRGTGTPYSLRACSKCIRRQVLCLCAARARRVYTSHNDNYDTATQHDRTDIDQFVINFETHWSENKLIKHFFSSIIIFNPQQSCSRALAIFPIPPHSAYCFFVNCSGHITQSWLTVSFSPNASIKWYARFALQCFHAREQRKCFLILYKVKLFPLLINFRCRNNNPPFHRIWMLMHLDAYKHYYFFPHVSHNVDE